MAKAPHTSSAMDGLQPLLPQSGLPHRVFRTLCLIHSFAILPPEVAGVALPLLPQEPKLCSAFVVKFQPRSPVSVGLCRRVSCLGKCRADASMSRMAIDVQQASGTEKERPRLRLGGISKARTGHMLAHTNKRTNKQTSEEGHES